MMGLLLIDQFSSILIEFARGGGGGSGGGHGGGYSGGSSSGGSGGGFGGLLYLVGMVSYIPMHSLGMILRKSKVNHDRWVVVRALGWSIAGAIALTCLILIPIFHSIVTTLYFLLPIAIGAIVGMAAGLHGWIKKAKQSSMVSSALRIAEKNDYIWNEKRLVSYTQGIFLKFQKDWSEFNTESMGRYLSPAYQNHVGLMLQALKAAHRINLVQDITITSAIITGVTDSVDDSEDSFLVGFTVSAHDQLFDDRDNRLLFQDNNSFTEFWRFKRSGNDWLLDGILQATQDESKVRNDIQQFAVAKNMYYSADWGWLLLPVDGYLFSKGRFGTSDINNHVIGYVNNTLTQLYTYQPDLSNASNGGDQYLVMQTNVPKTYGRILVRRRSKLLNVPVRGLTQMKMEWGEFNNLYDVFASDLERATSFELLNPAFMAQLRDLPFAVNIEVVDNVVYIYTKAGVSTALYESLYEILLKAHKEMKL